MRIQADSILNNPITGKGFLRTRRTGGIRGLVTLSLATLLLGTSCHFSIGGGDRAFQPLDEVTIPTGFTFSSDRKVSFSLTISTLNDLGAAAPYEGPVLVLDSENRDGAVLGYGFSDSAGKATFNAMIPHSADLLIIRPTQSSEGGLYPAMEWEVSLSKGSVSVVLSLSPPEIKEGIVVSSVSESMRDETVRTTGKAAPFLTLPAGYLSLSTHSASTGLPSGLLKTTKGERPYISYKQSFKRDVSYVFPDGKKVPDTLTSSESGSILTLKTSTGVILTFAAESTSLKNSIGYYVVPAGSSLPGSSSAVSVSDIVVAFPNASLSGSGGALVQGDSIRLLNPLTTSSNYGTETFDAGMRIIFVLLPNAFVSGTVAGTTQRFYSLPSLNPETGSLSDRSHAVKLLYDRSPYNRAAGNDKSFFLLGFEDSARKPYDSVWADDDFNDVLLALTLDDPSASDETGVTVLDDGTDLGATDTDKDGVTDTFDEFPTDAARAYRISYPSTTGWATALYEDLWPSLGDYDFNDLVVNFRLTAETSATGRAVTLASDLLVRATGAEQHSGLALRINVPSAAIQSWSGSAPVTGFQFAPGSNGVETEGTSSIIPLFRSGHELLGATGYKEMANTNPLNPYRNAAPVTVKVNFTADSSIKPETLIGEAPDLFLVGNLEMPLRTGTRKEIHALGNMPTSRADTYPFGELDDRSPKPPAEGLYYHDRRGAPWALIIPSEIEYTQERLQFASAYRYFSSWVYSRGTEYTDWYRSDKAEYSDPSRLYLLEP